MSGAHYELTRRLCRQGGVYLSLLPIASLRSWLAQSWSESVRPGAPDNLPKK